MNSSWPIRELRDCATWYSGGTPSKKNGDFWGGDIPWISAKSLKDFFVSDSEDRVTKLGAENGTRLVPQDSVLFVVRGMSLKTEFRVGIATRPVTFNQDVKALVAKEGVHPGFLAYAIRARCTEILGLVREAGHGTGVLPTDRIQSLQIPVPSMAIQERVHRVARALDDKIELNRKMNETLEAMARAIFKSWFVDFDPVRAKADGRQPAGMDAATADLFPDSFEDSPIGPVPKGWKAIALGELVELQRGNTYKSALKGQPGPYLLGLAAIHRNGGFRDDKLVTYGGESAEKILVEPSDLFVSLKDVTQSADLLGAVARVPRRIRQGRMTQDTVKLIFKDQLPISNVVFRTLLTPECRAHCKAHATGTTNLGLPRDDFLGYPIMTCPDPTLEAFNRIIESLDDRSEEALMESQVLASTRDALLPRLLSGELSVHNTDSLVGAVA